MINQCKKCGSKNLYLEPRVKGQDIMTANMVALKCKNCDTWLKWCPKSERINYITASQMFDNFDNERENVIKQLKQQLEEKDKEIKELKVFEKAYYDNQLQASQEDMSLLLQNAYQLPNSTQLIIKELVVKIYNMIINELNNQLKDLKNKN